MAQHDHPHGKDHQHHEHQSAKRGIHRSPIFWIAVILMLVGMAIYVTSMDEAIGPGGVNQEVPADAE
jgi:hypothetical protein